MNRARWFACSAALLASCANVDVPPIAGDRYDRCDDPSFEQATRALAAGDLEAALAALQRAVSACPNHVPAHQLWIRLARDQGGAAEAAMRNHYASWPDRGDSPVVPYVQSLLAYRRVEGGSPQDVDSLRVAQLEEAIARDRSFHHAYLDLAEIWGRNDRIAKQLDYLEKAVQAKPDAPLANLALARVLVSLGRGEEAVPRYERYLRAERPGWKAARPGVDADVEPARELVRLLLYGLERVDEAEPWLAWLATRTQDETATWMDQAAFAWLKGDRDGAAAFYRRVLAAEPSNARAALNLGNLWLVDSERPDDATRDEDWRRARQAYRYFLALAQHADVHVLQDLYVSVPFRLGVIARELGPLPADAAPARLGEF